MHLLHQELCDGQSQPGGPPRRLQGVEAVKQRLLLIAYGGGISRRQGPREETGTAPPANTSINDNASTEGDGQGSNIPKVGDVVDPSLDGVITDIAYPSLNMSTLKDLVDRCGEGLTWTDFNTYYSEDIGSGLYILRYPIETDYCLMIGGTSTAEPPLYIRPVSGNDSDNYIDVRTDSIDDFVSDK